MRDIEFSESNQFPFVCQVGALQREACARNSYWQQQRQREEDLLCDLDSGLFRCLFRVTEANCYEVHRGIGLVVNIFNFISYFNFLSQPELSSIRFV